MAFNPAASVIAVHVASKSAALMQKTIAERIIATERTIERTFFDVFIMICLLNFFGVSAKGICRVCKAQRKPIFGIPFL